MRKTNKLYKKEKKKKTIERNDQMNNRKTKLHNRIPHSDTEEDGKEVELRTGEKTLHAKTKLQIPNGTMINHFVITNQFPSHK